MRPQVQFHQVKILKKVKRAFSKNAARSEEQQRQQAAADLNGFLARRRRFLADLVGGGAYGGARGRTAAVPIELGTQQEE